MSVSIPANDADSLSAVRAHDTLGIAPAVECDASTRVASQLDDQVLAAQHLDTLLAHAPFGVAFFDLNLRFLRINEHLAEINGYSVAAHLGKTVEEMLPALATRLREVAVRILATGQPALNQEIIGETARAPGIVRYWHASWYAVRDERGEITGFSSMVVDITESKQADDALRRSEQRFRSIFDSAFQFIGLMTPDGTLVEANRTALKAGGLRAENVIGKPFWECDWWTLSEQTGQELRTAIGRAASGELVRYDANVRGANGQVLTIDFSIKPIRDETGQVVLLIPEGRDITDLCRAQGALRARTAELETLLDTLPGFVWISRDAECLEIVGNRTANEFVRVDRGANVSQSVVATGVAPYLRQLKEDGTEYRAEELPLQRAIFTGIPVRDAVLDFHFSDGRRVQVVGDSVPLFDDQGRVRGGLAVFVDITERKRTEKVLRENEKRLQKVISVQNVGVLFFKLDGHMLDANGALERMIGYTAEELRRITDWAELTPPEFMDVTRRAAAELAERGATAPYEKQWIRKDGSRFWGMFSPTRLSGSGSESECVEFIIDITQTKRAEEQLRLHRQLLETTVHHLPAAVALIRGSDLTFQIVNPGYQALAPDKQMTGKTIAEVWPEHMPLFGQRCGRVLETGEPIFEVDERFENRRDREGPLEVTYFSWSIRKVNLLDEVQPGLLITCWETTASKTLEVALAERTALLSGVLEGTTDLIFVKDLNGRMLLVNTAFATAVGSTPELLVGKTDADWFTPDLVAAVRQQDEAVIAGGLPMEFEETLPVAGEARVFLTLKAPLRDGSGRVVGLLGISRDITERKQIELNLQAATAEAERANRAKSEFLSNMSHEFRTPLNAILGFAQLLESGAPAPTPSQKQSLEHILKGGWYLLDLVSELLDLSQIESGKLSLKQEAVSLASVLLECRDMIESQARERGISVIFPPVDILGDVRADHTRLKQVLINLLSNAVKYNKAHGAVTVEFALSPPDLARISVRDTGEGLAPEQLAQLFQPFNRIGREAGPEQGTGIGLAMSRHMVESMGGAIGVESVVGVGSVFWFELKRASAEKHVNVTIPAIPCEN